ncbi:nuclear transport factor 2 family protein [Aureivirga marina]|uniref:nuclear transport factor 2 family protein n=1 Tax=Aureivirga marina TaxID=1182451 RepID=UPI001E3D5E99|nr:nuclear transport factor 2 family protein [Aureivirga marina]
MMNLRLLFSGFLILWTTNNVIGQNNLEPHKDSLENIVEKYYDLNIKVFQADSKREDIDKVFELFTEDFTYIHPQYGGVYSRKDLYDGYVRNQENGGYTGEEADVKIINKIIGLNAVSVQRSYVLKKDGKLEDGNPQMTHFEFQNGKIYRITEYW